MVCCVCIRSIQVPDLDWDKKFHKMAKETEGFSGREIAKLAISWQVCTLTGLKPGYILFGYDVKTCLLLKFLVMNLIIF